MTTLRSTGPVRASPPPTASAMWLSLVFVLSCFAANSILCRLALSTGSIDPESFSSLRLGSAALVLLAGLAWRRRVSSLARLPWDARAAACLALYSTAFAWAYDRLGAAAGGLVLFATVQASLLAVGVFRGERLRPRQWIGVAGAFAGGVLLLLPGVDALPGASAWVMVAAGLGWAGYTLRGSRGASDPTAATAANFALAFLAGLAWQAARSEPVVIRATGLLGAVLSGAVASAGAYVVWYRLLPRLSAARAAIVQLAVPPLTALGGLVFLGESHGSRFWACAALILVSLGLLRGPYSPARASRTEAGPTATPTGAPDAKSRG